MTNENTIKLTKYKYGELYIRKLFDYNEINVLENIEIFYKEIKLLLKKVLRINS